MSHRHVSIPLPIRPFILTTNFLFRIGQGDLVYRLMGQAFKREGPNTFGKYTPTENDIIVASLARSGTHWLMQIALQIAHRGEAEYDYIYDIVPWPDFIPGAAVKLTDPPPPSPTGLRVIKSHSPAAGVPINDAAKYITIIRDPKEVMVSLYHFAPQAYAFMGFTKTTPDYHLEKFLNNQVPGGWWVNHTASWWALRDKPNVHIVTFNDLKADPQGQIDQISAFLGVDLSPDQRQQVIEKSSFAYMKANNHKFSPIIDGTDSIDIVRKGKTGTDGSLFTPEQLAQVDAQFRKELKEIGSDFPYDETFG